MNKKHYLVGITTLVIIGAVAIQNLGNTKDYYKPVEVTSEQTPFGSFEYLHSLRANQHTNKINPMDVAAVRTEMGQAKLHKSDFPIDWESAGPDNIGGRSRAILIDRNDNNILYVGAVSGGLYKSINKGASWYAVDDHADNLNVCSITQTANGTIYYGTGESFATGPGGSELGTPGFPGNGIYKSTDGGETFSHLSSTSSYTYTNRMVAHPTNNVVFAATNSGLRYSEDDGDTWKIARAGNCRDVIIDKNGNLLVYAANRVYRSTDPTNNSSYVAVTGISSTGTRLGLAVSESDPNYIYAVVVSNGIMVEGTTFNNALYGLFQSTDNGVSFTEIVGRANQYFQPFSRNATGGQGSYDLAIGVHPTNKERVFIGGIFFAEWSKENGPQIVGNIFDHPANPFGIHSDKHVIVFDSKSNPPIMYIGHDGGISKTTNSSLNNYITINNGYQTTQYYGIAASRDGKVIGGTQDNSTILIDGQGSTPQAGFEIFGGDGFKAEISQKNNNVFFVLSQYGRMARTLNGGGTPSSIWDERITPEFVNASTPNNIFNTPIRLWEGDTLADNNLFYALNRGVWMARNATTAPSPIWYKIATTSFAPHVMEATEDGAHLFVSGLNGSAIIRIDGLQKANFDTAELVGFTQISDSITTVNIRGNLPSRTITDIEVDINNPNRVIVTMGNYGNTSFVYRTLNALDASPTWTSIQGALPRFPVYDAEINYANPNEIILGTEFGIWATTNGNSATPTWTEQNQGFPRVPVFEMRQVEISEKDQNGNYVWRTGPKLYAGTHGRGVFKTSEFLTSVPSSKSNNVSMQVFPNPAKSHISYKVGATVSGEVTYQVYDMQGRIVLSGTHSAQSQSKIDIASIKTGSYILSITGRNFKSNSKFIKYN
jgi:photosystem II stability/assembly factor-like uncharacterized protein